MNGVNGVVQYSIENLLDEITPITVYIVRLDFLITAQVPL